MLETYLKECALIVQFFSAVDSFKKQEMSIAKDAWGQYITQTTHLFCVWDFASPDQEYQWKVKVKNGRTYQWHVLLLLLTATPPVKLP